MPDLQDEQIVQAIASAPSGTVRTVLRALCADEETKLRIGRFLSQLPLTYEAWDQSRQASSSGASRKRKTAPQIEICVQCESPFEKGDESLTCRHHPYDMELDDDGNNIAWADWPDWQPMEDSPYCREVNPNGFTFPCCGEPGSRAHKGCKMGKHRAADGKRGKYKPSKNKNGILAALEELEAKERKERAENWVPKRDGFDVFASQPSN